MQRILASLWLNMVHCMQYIHACHQGEIVYVTEKTEKLLLWHNNRQKSASGDLGWIKSSLRVKNSSAFLHSSKKKYFPKFIPPFLVSRIAEKKWLEYRLKELEDYRKWAVFFTKCKQCHNGLLQENRSTDHYKKAGSVRHMTEPTKTNLILNAVGRKSSLRNTTSVLSKWNVWVKECTYF